MSLLESRRRGKKEKRTRRETLCSTSQPSKKNKKLSKKIRTARPGPSGVRHRRRRHRRRRQRPRLCPAAAALPGPFGPLEVADLLRGPRAVHQADAAEGRQGPPFSRRRHFASCCPLPEDQARKAVATVLEFLKQKLPAPIAGQIDSAVSGSSPLGGLGKMFG